MQSFNCKSTALKSILIGLNAWKPWKQYMKVLYNPIIKKLPDQIPTIMVISCTLDKDPHHQKFTLASAIKGMYLV